MIRLLLVVAVAALSAFAKDLTIAPGSYSLDLAKYDFIDTTVNIIQFPKGNGAFTKFFEKMDTLVFENKGQVRIMHVGGSHLQADVISGRIREHMIKEYPGASAGRGFVFPYSAARTNTPSSYASYYKGIWDKNKNVQREISKPLGLLGIAVSTSDPRAEITLMLDKYNSAPIWGETRFRLFGYSDNNDVVPVLRVDSTDIYGVHDTVSQSYVFESPRPIDTIQIQFRWMDSLKQASIAQFINDSLLQDSLARLADSLKTDSLSKDSLKKNGNDTGKTEKAKIPANVLNLQNAQLQNAAPEVARDSMFQGECDVLDTACLAREEAKTKDSTARDRCAELAAKKASINYEEGEQDPTNNPDDHCFTEPAAVPDSVKKNARPRFTLTGILSENDSPGIIYTNVGINGAKVHDYFEEVCPQFEKEMAFFKPDLVIFAIGINDANVQRFNDKQFREDYDRLIERFKKVNPDVAFIFETNNDMFRKVKRKKFVQHGNGEVARKSFFMLADKHKAGVWDKFSIMGGLGSMAKWEHASLAKKDKVHFNLSGYNLLGDLFYKALIQAYQDHIANLPAQTRRENGPTALQTKDERGNR